eukprot:9318470-Prorocentrum_lima.AAC.1
MLGQVEEIVALMEGPPSPGDAQVCASPLYPQHAAAVLHPQHSELVSPTQLVPSPPAPSRQAGSRSPPR